MFFFSSKLYFRLLPAFLLTFVFFSANQTSYSQKSRSKQNKVKTQSAAVAERDESQSKSAKKNGVTSQKPTAKNKKNAQTELKKKAEEEKQAAIEAERRRAAQEAALQEKARREQAIRAAQARKRELENSFLSETAANIARDDISGEDSEIRRAAVSALGSRAGTILVMEAQTGKILTLVNQDWAIHKSFKPCSTIKLVTAVAGLDKNLIDSDGNIRSGRSRLTLDDALAYSNNGYFQAVGANLGSNAMISYAQRLGLGSPTGINADGETAGRLPFGNNNLRIYSHGDDYEVTPLQLGVMVSAIANGGKVIVPQILSSKVQKTSFRGYLRREINLPKDDLQGVLPGMIGAAEYGTARRGVDSSLGIAGKTGSCIEKGSWVGLFASVAPIADPQYTVVVITRGQGERGKYAAAVAGRIYQVLGRRINNGNQNIAKVPLILKPQTKINPKTAAAFEEDESEDFSDVVAAEPRKLIVVDEKPVAPKRVTNNLSKVFSPVIIGVKKRTEDIEDLDAPTRPRVVKQN